jgi:DNA-directed RNA polymerase specialized sigma24 family protein
MPAAVSPAAWADAHRAFGTALGRIDAAIGYHFRRWPRRHREDAVAEARAYTWAAWHGLLARGKDPAAVGPVAITANCCRAVKRGRAVGAARPAGRGRGDALDLRALRELGLRIVPLEESDGAVAGAWREGLNSGRRYGPADEAAFRVDFAAWLAGLPARPRRVAELLAAGFRTGEVARRLGVTTGAVSQARARLARSWGRFQAGADVV